MRTACTVTFDGSIHNKMFIWLQYNLPIITSEEYYHNRHLCKTVIPGTIVKHKGFTLHKTTQWNNGFLMKHTATGVFGIYSIMFTHCCLLVCNNQVYVYPYGCKTNTKIILNTSLYFRHNFTVLRVLTEHTSRVILSKTIWSSKCYKYYTTQCPTTVTAARIFKRVWWN